MRSEIRWLKDKSPELVRLLRSLSRARFENISGHRILSCDDHPAPGDYIYGSHQAVIQIAAKNLRITFKSHYSITHTELTLGAKAGGKNAEQREKAIADLFMEYSNLVAGGLSQELHRSGVVSGISLPMATSGFDELMASDPVRPKTYFDYWLITGEDFRFTCTAEVDIPDDAWLKNFHYADESPNPADGELEFL